MIPVDGANGVATEFCLLQAGVNTYNDGDKILFDDEAAASVMKRYQARGIDLMADYEHQSLVRPPVIAPASAKKWLPEVRGGSLYATQIAWTDKAKSMLEAGEYRYFSIACRVDTKSGRCIELINFALTNLPAADGIAALVAASQNFNEENEMTKTLIVALGLNADADEAAAVAQAARLADLERDVLALTKSKTLAEAAGALRAMSLSHEKVVALTAERDAARAEKRGLEFDALVKEGDAARKLTPAMQAEWIPSLRTREDGCEILKSFLASAASVVEKAAEAPKELVQDASAPTADEYAVAKCFVGDDPIAINKRIEEVRALNATLNKGKV